ncbi:MAG TPA: zf-HC2 domain-containing protein [Bryobacteraceae bacterium]|nr:zf-HC2 domain-containing protein [Bryobacteraceae bacterium]
MRCPLGLEESRELVVGYAAGTLDPHTRVSFERHIESCGVCADEVAGQQVLWHALDEWRGVAVSPDFDRALQARIARDAGGANWLRRSWHPALPVAVAGIVLGLGLWLNQRAFENPDSVPAQSAQMQKLESALNDMDLLGQLSLN